MKKIEEGFNGFSNKETWLTVLWIKNDSILYGFAKKASDPLELEHFLRSEICETSIEAEVDESFHPWLVDLLRYAVDGINWREVFNTVKGSN